MMRANVVISPLKTTLIADRFLGKVLYGSPLHDGMVEREGEANGGPSMADDGTECDTFDVLNLP